MSVKNRLTKYKLQLGLTFLKRLWASPRNYSERPSDAGPCSHCIFKVRRSSFALCTSRTFPPSAAKLVLPRDQHTQGSGSVPSDTFHTSSRWKRGLSSQCLKAFVWETDLRCSLLVLTQASSVVLNQSLYPSASVQLPLLCRGSNSPSRGTARRLDFVRCFWRVSEKAL